MIDLDHAIIQWIHGIWRNPFLDTVMPVITTFGEWEILVAIAIALFLFHGRDTKTLGILLLLSLCLAHIIGPYIKESVGRLRPYLVHTDIKPLVKAFGFSFPSGHALYAFTAAALVCAFLKRHHVLYFFAALIALSRVYLGVHFPSDVLGGALIGIVIGWSTYGVYYFVDLLLDRFRRKA